MLEQDYFVYVVNQSGIIIDVNNLAEGSIHVHRAGYNPTLQNGAEELVWGHSSDDQYYSATAATHNLVSSSASDTAVQVYIQGLDSSWNLQSETVTLNGTTAVNTTKQYIRVLQTIVVDGHEPVGNITIKDSTNVVAYIAIGFGRGLKGAYTIPAGYTGYLLKGSMSAGKGGDCMVKMKIRQFGGTWVTGHVAQAYQGQYTYDFPVPLVVPEKSDIKVTATSTSTGTSVGCNFDIVLVPNP